MVDRGDNRPRLSVEPLAWPLATVVWLAAITVVAAAVRLFHLEVWPLSPLEATTWRAVTMPLGGDDGFFASPEGRHPLAYLLLRRLLEGGLFGGGTEGWLRLPFAFFGIATVPLFAVAMARHAGHTTALLAAAMLAVHPWHVFVSQSADPRAAALLLAVVALVAVRHDAPDARRRGWVVATLLLVAAGLSHPLGWCCALEVFLVVTMRHWHAALRGERLGRGLGAVLLGFLMLRAVGDGRAPHGSSELLALPLAGLTSASAVVLVLATAGLLLVRPLPRGLALGGILPAVLAPIAAVFGGEQGADIAAAALLPLLLAAALFVCWAWQGCREVVPQAPQLAVLPAALALGLCAVETFLYTTTHSGNRAPWRKAATAVLGHVHGSGRAVAVGIGSPSLCYYLLPNHWRQPVEVAHEGLRLVPLDGDVPAAVAALPADVDFIVLREDERVEALADAAAAARLAGFEILRALPCPVADGDATLTVYRRADTR